MNKKAKSLFLGSVLLLVLSLAVSYLIYADVIVNTINGQAPGSTYYSSTAGRLYNFSITSAGAININQTNFTFSGLTLVLLTNGTDAFGTALNFSNTLQWVNATGGLIAAGATNNFWFNLTGADGLHNITIVSQDANGIKNTTIVNVTIDTIAPTLSINFPINYANLTSKLIRINISANDTNINYTSLAIYSGNTLVNTSTNNTSLNLNMSVLLTVSSDGNYTINQTVYDKAGNINSTTIQVFIDTTGPVSVIINPAKGANISSTGIIPVNASVTDAGVGIVSFVQFNVSDATGVQKTILGTSNISTYFWNVTGLNVSNLTAYPDGIYKITLLANDSLNNLANNLEIANFTIDRVAPSKLDFVLISKTTTALTFLVNISDATSGVAGSCSIDGSTSSVTGAGTSQNVTKSGLTCATTYTYIVNCTDQAGNVNSTSIAYTTADCETTSQGSSSGSSSTVPKSTDMSLPGYTKMMIVAEQLKFNVGAEQHSIFVQSLIGNSLVLKISSTPQIATFQIGDEKKFELTGDNYYDLYIKFNSIKSGAVNLTIQTIHESMTPAITLNPQNNTSASTASAGTPEVTSTPSKSNTGIIVAVIIVLLIVGLAWFFISRKKK